MNIKYLNPKEIEERSMEIISAELKLQHPQEYLPVIKRVIHTTADFEYEKTLIFSKNAVKNAMSALRSGCTVVTDTNMALQGINKKALRSCNSSAVCYMSDISVIDEAERRSITRAIVSMEHAVRMIRRNNLPVVFAIGNAPTALIRLCELIRSGKISPALVIGVPVGFVNVTESKEMLLDTDTEYIVNTGRKGGSTVAAAICNALLYGCKQASP